MLYSSDLEKSFSRIYPVAIAMQVRSIASNIFKNLNETVRNSCLLMIADIIELELYSLLLDCLFICDNLKFELNWHLFTFIDRTH